MRLHFDYHKTCGGERNKKKHYFISVFVFLTFPLLFPFSIVIMIISDDLFISFSFLVKQANYMFVFTLMVPLLLMKFHKLTHGVVLCSPAAVLLFCQEQKTLNKFSIQYFYHAVIFSIGHQTATKLKNER